MKQWGRLLWLLSDLMPIQNSKSTPNSRCYSTSLKTALELIDQLIDMAYTSKCALACDESQSRVHQTAGIDYSTSLKTALAHLDQLIDHTSKSKVTWQQTTPPNSKVTWQQTTPPKSRRSCDCRPHPLGSVKKILQHKTIQDIIYVRIQVGTPWGVDHIIEDCISTPKPDKAYTSKCVLAGDECRSVANEQCWGRDQVYTLNMSECLYFSRRTRTNKGKSLCINYITKGTPSCVLIIVLLHHNSSPNAIT